MRHSVRGVALLRQLLALVVGLSLLVLGVMFSVVVLTVLAVVGAGFFAYFWWKTRALRRSMREQAEQRAASNGDIIEGEAIVVSAEPDEVRPLPTAQRLD